MAIWRTTLPRSYQILFNMLAGIPLLTLMCPLNSGSLYYSQQYFTMNQIAWQQLSICSNRQQVVLILLLFPRLNPVTANNVTLPDEITKAVYWAAVYSGADKEYLKVRSIYLSTKDTENEWIARSSLIALMGSKEPYLCQRTLLEIIDGDNYTTTLEKIALASMMLTLNPSGQPYATDYIVSKFGDLVVELGMSAELEMIPDLLVSVSSTTLELLQLEDFLYSRSIYYNPAFISRTINQVNYNINIVKCNQQQLWNFFFNPITKP